MAKFAANLSMLFTEYPFIERFAQASHAGFHGVEYLFPYDFSADELVSQLHQHNLTQFLFNLPAGNWQEGERGIACHPGRAKEFQEGVCRAIEYAQALNCSQVNCLAGKHPGGYSHEQCHET
ncbi:TIM barrel protein, partial [Escherichia coli]|nr:TIM barrel protein [Escherichia coli]